MFKQLLIGLMIISGVLVTGLLLPAKLQAQAEAEPDAPIELPASPTFSRGKVLEILATDQTEIGGYSETYQKVRIELIDKQVIEADYILPLGAGTDRLLTTDLSVVVARQAGEGGVQYTVTDFYRLPSLLFIIGLFVVVIMVFSGIRGVTALAGLGFSIWLLLYYVVPSIAQGADPMTISLISSVVIAGIALYLAHGFNRRTTLSLVSTLITLSLSVVTAISFVSVTRLFGLGSEASIDIQYGALKDVNLKGLLLAGIIIGALGVLDDITTAQTAAIEEIHKANNTLGFHELYLRGMSVGREHITSLVNTLALAYAGASLPMLLLFTVYQQPLWVTLNSEHIVEEVVRTVVGSFALTLAVPISTLIAAYWYGQKSISTPLQGTQKTVKSSQ